MWDFQPLTVQQSHPVPAEIKFCIEKVVRNEMSVTQAVSIATSGTRSERLFQPENHPQVA